MTTGIYEAEQLADARYDASREEDELAWRCERCGCWQDPGERCPGCGHEVTP